MRTYTLAPLHDPRWARFVERNPQASIFHTQGWLEALNRTYGYEPVVYTTASPLEELTNGLVFCRIDSWITGRRLVSLPFSDHCEPLVKTTGEVESLITSALESARWDGYKYIEVRPLTMDIQADGAEGMTQSKAFYLHTVDLRPELKQIFLGFHKSCVQRKIKRAEREGLSCEGGRSPELLKQFYQLQITTRRRHQLPPQPLAWFENLVSCLGDMASIYIARKDGRPIAGILTLSFKDRTYYKYGASAEAFLNLGGMQMLLWQAIQEAKESGAQFLDLGRSNIEHSGLVDFKDHLGSTRSPLTYYRYPPANNGHKIRKWGGELVRYVFSRLPDSLLTTAGRLLYPHIG